MLQRRGFNSLRVVLDFQACQSGSRYRGIGRASRSLMLAMARLLLVRGHEVICLLNAAFENGMEVLKADITAQVPQAKLEVFQVITPCAAAWPENAWRQMAARLLRELAIASLEPDFVHIPALLADGWGDDAVASVGLLEFQIPVSLTQHDLIPLVMAESYMPPSPFRDYYMVKLENAKKADLLLAISEYSQREAIEWLNLKPEYVVNISSAADGHFWQSTKNSLACQGALQSLGVRDGFFLYAPGGFDYRKNIDRLFEAYAMLPVEVRTNHQLVIASSLDPGRREILSGSFERYGLRPSDVLLTDYVSDKTLKHLYSSCFAYVFPSLHEGFGLPALEAMSCGAPVIASNCTSIPEVVGMEEGLFDPYDPCSIATRLLQLHTDAEYRTRLLEHAKIQPSHFSWQASAKTAVDAIVNRHHQLVSEGWRASTKSDIPSCENLLERMSKLVPSAQPSLDDLTAFRMSYEHNLRYR